MKNFVVGFIALVAMFAANMAMAIPTEVSDALTAQATEVATYTGPAVVFAVAVATAGIAIKWTKRFIGKAS